MTSSSQRARKGRVAVIGAGPGGLATALALHKSGYDVKLYEKYDVIKAAGNILNLWPPPQKVLKMLGVDTTDLGAPALSELRRYDGRVRAHFNIPDEVIAEYNGGFIGLLRWGLYKRMIDALPEGVLKLGYNCTGIRDTGDEVVLTFDGHEERAVDLVVGADGIESTVRKHLWGDSPIRYHGLHLFGGYFFVDGTVGNSGVFAHDRTVQGSFTPIRHEGRYGYEWWVVEPWEPGRPFTGDILTYARDRVRHFEEPLPSYIARTDPEHTHHWEIRDRPPLSQWSKNRITLVGDAAHPTSPYAAYGAGMSIEDGYYLAKELEGVDLTRGEEVRAALQRFEDVRKPHTSEVTQQAYITGKMFHLVPAPLRPLRDFIFDHTSLLQKNQGDALPAHIMKQLDQIVPLASWSESGAATRE